MTDDISIDAVSQNHMRPARTVPLQALRSGLWLPVGVVVALCAFFAMATPSFLTLRNASGILGQASTLLLACLGASFVVLMGSIDLSVGAMVLLTGAVTVTALNAGGIGVLALPLAVMFGTGLGLANGAIFAFGRMPSFVVTLGTLSFFTGAGWQLLEGRALRFNSTAFENLAIGNSSPTCQTSLCLRSLLGPPWRSSDFGFAGCYMYIIGGGEAVARTAGMPVRRYQIYAFALSGAMAGFAGALAAARLGAAGPTLGQDLLLNSLAAIVVGGTSLSGGVGGVHRTLIGVLIIALLDNGLNLMGVNQYTQMMVKGAVVLAAVLVSQTRTRQLVIK